LHRYTSVTDAPHPLPKRWIIGGTVYARTLKGAGPAAVGVVGYCSSLVISQQSHKTLFN
jgi:hypothetical protein